MDKWAEWRKKQKELADKSGYDSDSAEKFQKGFISQDKPKPEDEKKNKFKRIATLFR